MKRAIGFGAAIIVVVGIVWWARFTPDVAVDVPPPAIPSSSTSAQTTIGQDEMEEVLVSAFPDAPQSVAEVARAVIGGSVPGPAQIAALSQDELNRAYSRPLPDKNPDFGHTLLRQAVLSRNLGAAEALIAAGAQAWFNQDEMGFLAINMNTSETRVWWPDYELGTRFLQLWLASGGDPNAINLTYNSMGTLLVAAPINNLEGILALLEAGADPWFKMPAPDDTSDDPYRYPGFFESLANSSPQFAEMSFRVALEGYYRGGTAEQHDALMAEYEVPAARLKRAQGPALWTELWHLQTALQEVLESLNIQPTGDVAAMMAVKVPDGYGGFWLGPGEIRSPTDGSQDVTNDNQLGGEFWRGH